jgi:hypothetical protein
LHYALGTRVTPPAGWELDEDTLPESVLHDHVVELLRCLLVAWAARQGGDGVLVARNLAVRFDESRPAIGLDPDVCVLSPAPPGGLELRSVRTWLDGHAPPLLAIEVVSESHPRKDYSLGPDKYAASGTGELVVFDPLLAGPANHGGPFRLQLWRRDEGGFTRVYAGDGPVHSPTLDAYLVPTDDGRMLRIANDEQGADRWLTTEEEEHARAERARSEIAAARARVAELEALLARRGS